MKRKLNASEQLNLDLRPRSSVRPEGVRESPLVERKNQIEGLKGQLFQCLPGSGDWDRLASEYNLALLHYVQDFEALFKEDGTLLHLPPKEALVFYRKAKLALGTQEEGRSHRHIKMRLVDPT